VPTARRCMSMINARQYALGLAATVLCACGTLPTSGPSRNEVQAEAKAGIQIIDVNEEVAKQLVDRRPYKLFSDYFDTPPAGAQVVGPGDVLEVSVWEAPPAVLFSSGAKDPGGSSGSAVVPSNVTTFPVQMIGSEGTIFIPFAGNIDAGGESVRDIETSITRKLHGKANQPQVLVRLVTNNTAYVTVVGEVTASVRMPVTPRGERLLDALAAAGGTRQPADKITLQVTRGKSVHSLPLDTIIRDPLQNIPLQPGDVITALYQPLSFTALGATGKSDEINFESKGISLAQALARVGGVIDTRSDAAGVFIFRFESKAVPGIAGQAATTLDENIPIIYRINLKDPRTFFVAQGFQMENKDVLYVANASAAEAQKFLNLLLTAVYPIEGAVNLSRQ
jgi:polysaccharide export outer membrane protein